MMDKMAYVIDPEYIPFGFGLGLPIVTYLYLFLVTRPRWIRAAPPPQVGEKPTPPQAVRPAFAGLLFDGRVGEEEFAATIVELLAKGYLSIVDKGNTIVILKQRSTDELPFFERTIAAHLIERGSIAKSELEVERRIGKKLYDTHISQAIRSLYQEAMDQGVFFEDPNIRYAWYSFVGLLFFFAGLVSLVLLVRSVGDQPLLLFFPLGLLLSGSTIISRARHLSPFSRGGRVVQEVWHDYRKELSTFPSGKDDLSLEFLSYALALGVESQWLERFSHLAFSPPEWFVSFKIQTREEFREKLSKVVSALSRNLFALRDPALKD